MSDEKKEPPKPKSPAKCKVKRFERPLNNKVDPNFRRGVRINHDLPQRSWYAANNSLYRPASDGEEEEGDSDEEDDVVDDSKHSVKENNEEEVEKDSPAEEGEEEDESSSEEEEEEADWTVDQVIEYLEKKKQELEEAEAKADPEAYAKKQALLKGKAERRAARKAEKKKTRKAQQNAQAEAEGIFLEEESPEVSSSSSEDDTTHHPTRSSGGSKGREGEGDEEDSDVDESGWPRIRDRTWDWMFEAKSRDDIERIVDQLKNLNAEQRAGMTTASENALEMPSVSSDDGDSSDDLEMVDGKGKSKRVHATYSSDDLEDEEAESPPPKWWEVSQEDVAALVAATKGDKKQRDTGLQVNVGDGNGEVSDASSGAEDENMAYGGGDRLDTPRDETDMLYNIEEQLAYNKQRRNWSAHGESRYGLGDDDESSSDEEEEEAEVIDKAEKKLVLSHPDVPLLKASMEEKGGPSLPAVEAEAETSVRTERPQIDASESDDDNEHDMVLDVGK
jgi:hypothetical protein